MSTIQLHVTIERESDKAILAAFKWCDRQRLEWIPKAVITRRLNIPNQPTEIEVKSWWADKKGID